MQPVRPISMHLSQRDMAVFDETEAVTGFILSSKQEAASNPLLRRQMQWETGSRRCALGRFSNPAR